MRLQFGAARERNEQEQGAPGPWWALRRNPLVRKLGRRPWLALPGGARWERPPRPIPNEPSCQSGGARPRSTRPMCSSWRVTRRPRASKPAFVGAACVAPPPARGPLHEVWLLPPPRRGPRRCCRRHRPPIESQHHPQEQGARGHRRGRRGARHEQSRVWRRHVGTGMGYACHRGLAPLRRWPHCTAGHLRCGPRGRRGVRCGAESCGATACPMPHVLFLSLAPSPRATVLSNVRRLALIRSRTQLQHASGALAAVRFVKISAQKLRPCGAQAQ